MKTRDVHVNNFGIFRPCVKPDFHGYVTIHDSNRYASMSHEDLEDLIVNHRLSAVRAAAAVEIADRAVANWQEA
jgi:hypothetical protein